MGAAPFTAEPSDVTAAPLMVEPHGLVRDLQPQASIMTYYEIINVCGFESLGFGVMSDAAIDN